MVCVCMCVCCREQVPWYMYATGDMLSGWWWRLQPVMGLSWYGREAGRGKVPPLHGTHPCDVGSSPGETAA